MTDIWAMGLSFYQILTGHMPFGDAHDVFELRDFIEKKPIDFTLIKCEKARRVIQSMLHRNATKRATLNDLVESDWVTDNGRETIEITNVNIEEK